MWNGGNPEPEIVHQTSHSSFHIRTFRRFGLQDHSPNLQISNHGMAVLAAYDDLKLHVPIVIRRDGPHANEAMKQGQEWAKNETFLYLLTCGD